MIIHTPISIGELLDKLTILQIKQQRITDLQKLEYIMHEEALLSEMVEKHQLLSPAVKPLFLELREINETLWDIEDDIRACERLQDFSDHFVQLARRVYFTNDRRAAIKQQINALSGSEIHEVKSYESYCA